MVSFFFELIIGLLNVLSWCCFKWILFLLQTCSHTYCAFFFLLGNYFIKCFHISVYPLPQLCKNVTFWFDVPKGCHRKVLPCLAVSKVYIHLLALFRCPSQSCRCPRSLKQCLGHLFELVIVHGLLLLGSTVHQECFLVSSPFWFYMFFKQFFSFFSLFKNFFPFFKGFPNIIPNFGC